MCKSMSSFEYQYESQNEWLQAFKYEIINLLWNGPEVLHLKTCFGLLVKILTYQATAEKWDTLSWLFSIYNCLPCHNMLKTSKSVWSINLFIQKSMSYFKDTSNGSGISVSAKISTLNGRKAISVVAWCSDRQSLEKYSDCQLHFIICPFIYWTTCPFKYYTSFQARLKPAVRWLMVKQIFMLQCILRLIGFVVLAFT